MLAEYTPFYFDYRTPMLYVVQKGFNHVRSTVAEKIIYCVSSVQQIVSYNLDFVFTDGHAVNSLNTLYYPSDIKNLNTCIDKNAIDTKYWNDKNDLDLKRRMEAEFLVMGDFPFKAIIGFVVYN